MASSFDSLRLELQVSQGGYSGRMNCFLTISDPRKDSKFKTSKLLT